MRVSRIYTHAVIGTQSEEERSRARTHMFSSSGSAASRAHSVCSVPFCATSRLKPALATTSPRP